MLTAFQAPDMEKPAGRILAVEETLRGSVIPGLPDLLGRVDLIVEEPDALVIHDWKTSRSRWTADQVEDAAEHLLLYAELSSDFAPGKQLRLAFSVLTKTKAVNIDQHVLPVVLQQADRMKRVRIKARNMSMPTMTQSLSAAIQKPNGASRTIRISRVFIFGLAVNGRSSLIARPGTLLEIVPMSPRISTGAWGLGSKVSCCGGPPDRNNGMQDFARPKEGSRGAIGPVSARSSVGSVNPNVRQGPRAEPIAPVRQLRNS